MKKWKLTPHPKPPTQAPFSQPNGSPPSNNAFMASIAQLAPPGYQPSSDFEEEEFSSAFFVPETQATSLFGRNVLSELQNLKAKVQISKTWTGSIEGRRIVVSGNSLALEEARFLFQKLASNPESKTKD